MYTKNKRKYQNKPTQRSTASQNYSTKPKYKTKKEQFLKSTLPALVLLLLFVFWTLASVFVFVDKFRFKKDSAMITASAAEGDLVYEVDLVGLRGLYFSDDLTYVLHDNISLSIVRNNIGNLTTITLYVDNTAVVNVYNEVTQFACDFIDRSNGLYELIMTVQRNDVTDLLSSLTSSYYISSVNYTTSMGFVIVQVIFSNGNTTLPLSLKFYNTEDFDFNLLSYTQIVTPSIQELVSLRNQLSILQAQLDTNISIIATKNAEIESLQSDLESNADLILQLQSDIESLEEENELLQATIQGAYSRGYDAGQVNGYETGFNEGQSSGNTFYRLISATIDVPIKAFTGLFDWNLLGINLKQFFLSILSLMAILAAVKLIMR